MKRTLLLLCLLAVAAAASATSSAQRSIVMDGDSSDFAEDEALFLLGEELAFDSRWGEYNDVNQIKATWNADTLFVAVDGYCWDNNVMLFFDTVAGDGIPDMKEILTGWNRKLRFIGREPDLFLATWDNNTAPQLWRAYPGTGNRAAMLGGADFAASASFSQGQPDRCMEGAIPWTTLFYGESLPPSASIALVAVVVTGADYLSGPDSAPNTSFGMPENSGDIAYIDNFVIIRPDRDGDGQADLGVSPHAREGDSFGEDAPMEFDIPLGEGFSPLRILGHEVVTAAFSPNGDGIADEASIEVVMSRGALMEGDVYDPQGRRIAQMESSSRENDEGMVYIFTWDGVSDAGEAQATGLYMARLNVVGLERLSIPLAVLR